MIEVTLTAGIIGLGIGFWIHDAIATRRWRNETMERRVSDAMKASR